MIRDVAADVNAEVLVSDDHGAYQEVVDDIKLTHQLCRHYVHENMEDFADDLGNQLRNNEIAPEDSDLMLEQLVTDLAQMRQVVRERLEDGEQQLVKLYDHYKGRDPITTRDLVQCMVSDAHDGALLVGARRKFTLNQQRGNLGYSKKINTQTGSGAMRTKYFSKSGSRSKRASKAAIALAVSFTPLA